MYWAEKEDDQVALVKASMDGSRLQTLKANGIINPISITVYAGSHVYWVDLALQHILQFNGARQQNFADNYDGFQPQAVVANNEKLFWVGKGTNSTEGLFCTEIGKTGRALRRSDGGAVETHSNFYGVFTGVSGIALYASLIHELEGTDFACQNHTCDGLCVLSGNGSSGCVCPAEYHVNVLNGSYCSGQPLFVSSFGKCGIDKRRLFLFRISTSDSDV